MATRYDEFTGKPVPGHIVYGSNNGDICDVCGTECIDRCPCCGAPQCCPRCCEETRMADAALEAGKQEETEA